MMKTHYIYIFTCALVKNVNLLPFDRYFEISWSDKNIFKLSTMVGEYFVIHCSQMAKNANYDVEKKTDKNPYSEKERLS